MTAKIKRYYTALRRYNRSKGFGIHSPFAFSFVLRVLRERLPYYAYDDIEYRRQLAKSLASTVSRHPKIISSKNAKMIFRITNYFNPRTIMQIGTSYGVSTTAVLDVDSRSRMILYHGKQSHKEIYHEVVAAHAARISLYGALPEALAAYGDQVGDSRPFMLINSVSADELPLVGSVVLDALEREGVVIMRNISRSKEMEALWRGIMEALGHGMSFTNGKLAVIVGYKYLPRQNFSLWF